MEEIIIVNLSLDHCCRREWQVKGGLIGVSEVYGSRGLNSFCKCTVRGDKSQSCRGLPSDEKNMQPKPLLSAKEINHSFTFDDAMTYCYRVTSHIRLMKVNVLSWKTYR